MARGTSLSSLVDMLRYEARHASAPSTGLDSDDKLKHMLRRKQQELYDGYQWPFLSMRPTKTLAAGQRYYDFPTDFNLETIDGVHVKDNGTYKPVERGITPAHLNHHDSDDDERADPVRCWDVQWTGSATQIEVWPIPATSGSILRFTGKRNLRALVADADVADLDDYLIVLFCAAEMLQAQDAKDAQIKAGLAQARLNILKARQRGGSAEVIMGSGGMERRPAGITARYNPDAG